MMAVVPPCNFIVLHYTYFIVTPLICSAIFWGASTPSRSVAYVDALFMCVSAITGAGLNSVCPTDFCITRKLVTDVFQVDLSSLNTFQQSILFALLILGHAILISITVLFVRNRAFHSKFQGISKNRAHDRRVSEIVLASNPHIHETCVGVEYRGAELASSKGDDRANVTAHETSAPSPQADDDHIRWVDDDQITIGGTKSRHNHNHHPHRVFPMVGVGARLDLNNHPRDVPPNLPIHEEEELTGLKGIFRGTQKYFSSKGFVSRNSSFHGLTPAERDELGGVEYRAVSFLSVIVPLYWLSFLLLGIIGVGGWLEANHPDISRSNGLSPFWTGAFFAVSAFVNSGMSLLDANMTALQTKYVFIYWLS